MYKSPLLGSSLLYNNPKFGILYLVFNWGFSILNEYVII